MVAANLQGEFDEPYRKFQRKIERCVAAISEISDVSEVRTLQEHAANGELALRELVEGWHVYHYKLRVACWTLWSATSQEEREALKGRGIEVWQPPTTFAKYRAAQSNPV